METENQVTCDGSVTTKKYTPEQSSQIVEISYNSLTGELQTEFKGGARYKYFAVPGEVFKGALDAESIGKYHAANIKRGYKYERMPDPLPIETI